MIEALPTILAGGMLAGIIYLVFVFGKKSKMAKEVLFLRPRDKRGEKMDITRETDISVMCEGTDPVHRFVKVGPSYIFKDGGRTVVRFFGVEGIAYTAVPKAPNEVKMDVSEYLRSLWTDKIYEALPKKLRDAVEKDKIGVTIDIEAPELAGDMKPLRSDDVNDEADAIVLQRLGKPLSEKPFKERMLNNLVWMLLGLGIAGILSNFGWF